MVFFKGGGVPGDVPRPRRAASAEARHPRLRELVGEGVRVRSGRVQSDRPLEAWKHIAKLSLQQKHPARDAFRRDVVLIGATTVLICDVFLQTLLLMCVASCALFERVLAGRSSRT